MPAYLAYGVYVNFVVGIYVKKKTIYLLFVTGSAAIINIILNYLLIPEYKMWGAAFSTAAAYVVMAYLLFLVSRRLYPVTYEYGRIFHIVCITGLLYALPAFYAPADNMLICLQDFLTKKNTIN